MLDLIVGLIQKIEMLEFGIILSLMLSVSTNAVFNVGHKTKLQLQAKVNQNNPALIQTYPMHLHKPFRFS